MVETLQVQPREARGTRAAKRLRASGLVPAVLYGHGGENVVLSVPSDAMTSAVRRGAKLVDLTGAVQQKALIRETKWNAFETELLHVDFTRVEVGESVETTVPIELRGDAPGSHQGGIIEQQVHEIQLVCPVTAIPEKITLSINELGLGDSISAEELSLPGGAKLAGDPSAVVVHCRVSMAPAEEVAAAEPVEPEVIGRKPDDEEADS